jgi:hypothetical protein
MAAPSENYELMKLHFFIELSFIGHGNLKNLLSTEIYVFIFNIEFLFNFAAQLNGTTPSPFHQLHQ